MKFEIYKLSIAILSLILLCSFVQVESRISLVTRHKEDQAAPEVAIPQTPEVKPDEPEDLNQAQDESGNDIQKNESDEERAKEHLGILIFATIIVLFAFIFLILFESRQSESDQLFTRLKAEIQIIDNPEEVNPKNDGKLVLVSGVIRSRDLADDLLKVKFRNKAQIQRRVEVYSKIKKITFHQSKDFFAGEAERRDEISTEDWIAGNSEIYFGPDAGQLEIRPELFCSGEVKIGDYKLKQDQVQMLQLKTQKMPLTDAQLTRFWPTIKEKLDLDEYELKDGMLYFHQRIDPSKEIEIGDSRIYYEVMMPHYVTILAKQTPDKSFEPYRTVNPEEEEGGITQLNFIQRIFTRLLPLLKPREQIYEVIEQQVPNYIEVKQLIGYVPNERIMQLRAISLTLMVIGMYLILSPFKNYRESLVLLGWLKDMSNYFLTPILVAIVVVVVECWIWRWKDFNFSIRMIIGSLLAFALIFFWVS